MTLTRENSTRGIRILLDQEHVKTVPERYGKIVRPKHILNPMRKRLTQEERFLLEVALFEKEVKQDHVLIYNLIKRSAPLHVRLVYPHNQPHYFLLTYRNGQKLRCPKSIFDIGYNIKEPIRRNY